MCRGSEIASLQLQSLNSEKEPTVNYVKHDKTGKKKREKKEKHCHVLVNTAVESTQKTRSSVQRLVLLVPTTRRCITLLRFVRRKHNRLEM